MPTVRLIPSTYYLSNSSYLSVSNVNNMYDNVDSTSTGSVTHLRQSSSRTYYFYLRGFNINDVPSDAIVSSFTVKIKAYATGHTTSTSKTMIMQLVNDTDMLGCYVNSQLSTSTETFTFSNGSLKWADVVNYGSNFGISIPLRRASSGTPDVVYVYGAEIEVTYTTSSTTALYVKSNGTWTQVTKAFKKVNGSWVEQDITTLFNSQTNYRRG